jgi:hypothetical protein
MLKLSKFLIAIFGSILLGACATQYSSLNAVSPQGGVQSEIVIGAEASVFSSILEGIHEIFPAASVQKLSDFSYGWYHQPMLDRTTYRLTVKAAKGVSKDGSSVSGFFFTVNTSGTQGMVEARYLNPLKEEIYKLYEKNGLKLVQVTSALEIPANTGGSYAGEVKACYEALGSDQALSPLGSKVALQSVSDQNFAMLTNSAKPTKTEQALILTWGTKQEDCMKLQKKANELQRTPPQIRTLLESYSTSQQALIAQLYLGKLSYAEFAAKRQAISSTTNEAIVGVQGVLAKQEADAQARADQIALQANQNMIMALQGVSQVIQQQQTNSLLQQQNNILQQQNNYVPPRRGTTCNFVGNTMFCN